MSDRPKFVHLHSHSDYSYLDAVITLQQYGQHIAKNDIRQAITQHGNLCSAGQMIASHDDRWILGLESYYVDSYEGDARNERYHILLLAKNKEGWTNLVKINNTACTNFYKKPIITMDDIKKHSEGLIVSSACQANKIAIAILNDDLEAAGRLASEYKEAFGENFYLELQYGTSKQRPKINEGLIKLSKELTIPMIVTNDTHLLRPQDQLSKDILSFISYGKKSDGSHDYSNLWLCPADQIMSRVPDDQKKIVEQAMENTVNIAYDKIDTKLVSSIDVSIKLPTVDTSGMVTQAVNKLKSMNLPKEQFDKYVERLKYEIKVISDIGAMGYFKVVADAVKLANDNNIYTGAGRGSAAASLLFYLLQVTTLDPIKYDLMFERFINPSAKIKGADDLPDADLDFEDPDGIRTLLRQKFGEQNVAQGCIFSSYAPKSLLKDILKYYDVPFEKANAMSKYLDVIETDIKMKAEDKAPDFSMQVLEQYPQFHKVFHEFPDAEVPFRTLYKRKRHIGRHAGAVVYLEDLTSKIPQYRSNGQVITAWGESGGNLKTLSKNGFVKFDFLGLKTMRIVHRCIDMIKNNYGKEIDYKKIPLQDPKVYRQTFNNQKFTGIFQFSGKGMRTLCGQVNPQNLNDISAVISLFRPACLKNDFHKLYITNKNGEPIQYLHDKVKQILDKSYGVILYQEQVFQLVRQIGGYSFEDVALFKKYILKVGAAKKYKDYEDQLRLFRFRFITHGSQKLGINKVQVEYLYDQILKFAAYGFCQAHASAYACDALWCAWLLTYYPVEWICALINQDAEESLPEIVKMYKPLLLPISAKKSEVETVTQKQQDGTYKIRLGFNLIKGLGQKSLLKFMQKRSTMVDPQDFLFGVTPSIIQKLVDSGALDEVEPNKKRFAMAVALLGQKKQNKITKKNFGQVWTRLQKVQPYRVQELYDLQMKTFGMSIFVNIWGQYGPTIKKFIMDGKAVLDFSNFKKFQLKLAYVPVNIFDVKTRKQKNGQEMAFVKFVTPSGQIRQSPVFSETWKFLKKKIKADFSVYFALFTYKQEKDGFILGDGVYGCNQLKANAFLLNLKYIARGQEQPDA